MDEEQRALLNPAQNISNVSSEKDRSHLGTKKKLSRSAVDQDKARKDPFLQLGAGMVAYRSMLENFICIFFILSFVAAFMISIYAKYGGVPNAKGYTSYSLANMGSSSAQCQILPVEFGKLPLDCPFGQIGEFHSIGINPSTAS